MPRKLGFQLDHDDDFGDYDDHVDYEDLEEYDDVQEIKGREPVVPKHAVESGIWRCSICTFDNDERMSFCDICGVLKTPSSNNGDILDKKTDGGVCPDSGVSLLAKSLFSSLPHQTTKKVVLLQPLKDSVVTEGAYMCHEYGETPRHHAIHNALGSYSSHGDVVSFKFDTPSPDDVISSGLSSSKIAVRDNPPAEKNKSLKANPNAKKVDCSSNVKEQDGMQEGGSPFLNSSSTRDNSYDAEAASNCRSSASSSALNAKVGHNTGDEANLLGFGEKPESMADDLKNTSLNMKTGSSKSIIRGKPSAPAQYTPAKWMLPDEGEDVKAQLNLAIVGHVDSGKSTLSGRLLHLLGEISQKDMHKYERESKIQGKGSFAYAWALDESTEERERGITMTVAVAYFDTKRYHVVVLDSPGHKDFVPNMISGATQADAAILVIDASAGSFEVGMDAFGGQTREHAQLIRSFGVDQVIVAVNKMDTVQYSGERFEIVKRQVGSFLRSCNFKDSLVSWIPLSAMENQNLVAAATDVRLTAWYEGPHLLEAIDSMRPPTREYRKPLLMPICDVIRTHSMGQVSLCGKLEAGALRSGCKVLVMPLGDVGTVRSVECNACPCSVARAGDSVAVIVQGVDISQVTSGGVLCHPDFPIRVATHLELKVLVLDVITPILVGSQLEFHMHHAREAAKVVKITSLLDPKTGKVTKKSPRCLLSKQNAVVQVVLEGGVCVEEFSKCKSLGRVFLRTSGRTIALGVVTQIIN